MKSVYMPGETFPERYDQATQIWQQAVERAQAVAQGTEKSSEAHSGFQEAYLQGFTQKCAEAGVDPEALVKFAAKSDAPDYRPATGKKKCSNCEYWTKSGRCTLYSFSANPKYTCDSWETEDKET